MRSEQEALALDRVAQRLTSQFTDLGQTEVGQVVDDCLSQFVDSPIRTFVPLLVEHAARTRLQTMSPARVTRTTSEHSPPTRSLRQILADGHPWAVL